MKNLISGALRFVEGELWVLDQQLLPQCETWLKCESPEQMVTIIQNLKVRGAPLIGVAAALALAQLVERDISHEALLKAAHLLRHARPTAVNLSYCIKEVMNAYQAERDPCAAVKRAEELFEEDARLSEALSTAGAGIIKSGENILTHCNTGFLVTTGRGTALGAINKAHEQAKKIHVYVDETRPLLQGARLTAWELDKANIPYTVLCDNMAASLMQAGKVSRVMVGADRIAANGDVANKVGTYGLAVLAHYHGIPFHVIAPETTLDNNCLEGKNIVIEERASEEVIAASGMHSPAYNPAFDVTPFSLITSIITDKGIRSF